MHGVVTVRNYYVLLLMRCLYNSRLPCVAIARCGENAAAHQGAPADALTRAAELWIRQRRYSFDWRILLYASLPILVFNFHAGEGESK